MEKFNGLTVRGLCDILSDMMHKNPNIAVKTIEIRTVDPPIGSSSGVLIADVCEGFDWDTGRVFLYSQEPLRKAERRE